MSLSLTAILAVAQVVIVPPGKGVDVGALVELGAPHSMGTGAKVITDRSGIAVVWTESRPQYTACIEGRRLARDGTPVGAVTELACGKILASPRIATGGTVPLVVWADDKGLVGVTYTARGIKPAFKVAAKDSLSLVDVAWDGSRYWVAWSNYNEIWVQAASSSGALTGKPTALGGKLPGHGELNKLAVRCPGHACGAYFAHFLGNSAFDDYVVAIAGTKVGALVKLDDNAWDEAVAAGDTTEASTTAGALMALHDDRTGLSFMFLPADPKLAHHTPIPLPGESEGAVVAIDPTTFLLVTTAAQISARRIKIDLAYFAKVPPPRPPVATGVVVASDGTPAAGARINCTYVLASSDTVVGMPIVAQRDGAFSVPHPAPNDHEPDLDVASIEVWADRDGESSKPESRPAGAQLAIRLGRRAHVSGTLDNAKGLDVTVEAEVWSADSTLRSTSTVWSKKVTARDKFDLGDVPSGPLHLRASAKDGRLAFTSLVLAPGQQLNAKLALARPGTLVLRVAGADGQIDALPLVEGVELDRVTDAQRDGAYEYRGLAPGRHLVVIVSDNWEMTRVHTVRPQGNAQVRVTYEADVRPGMIGVVVEMSTYGLQLDVGPGSPAEHAGLSSGDTLLEVDGTKPADGAQARKLIAGQPGTPVKLLVSNGAGTHTVTATRSTGTGAFDPAGIPELASSRKVGK